MKKTIRVMCMIHESAFDKRTVKTLQSMLQDTYRGHFGTQHTLTCVWMILPSGQAYLAAKPSSASTVQIPVADHLAQDKRHAFMADLCAQWQTISGCSKNQIILTAPDQRYAEDYFATVNRRFNPSRKTLIQLALLLRILFGRLKRGYLSTTVNF